MSFMNTKPQPENQPEETTQETSHAPFWRETWFYEQCVHGILLLFASWKSYEMLALKGPIASRDVVLLVCAALSQFVAQKARSVASRQQALIKHFERMGFSIPTVRCAHKVKIWSQFGQVLGSFLNFATAPSLAHLPLVIWGLVAYDAWRAYRENRKQTPRDHTEEA